MPAAVLTLVGNCRSTPAKSPTRWVQCPFASLHSRRILPLYDIVIFHVLRAPGKHEPAVRPFDFGQREKRSRKQYVSSLPNACNGLCGLLARPTEDSFKKQNGDANDEAGSHLEVFVFRFLEPQLGGGRCLNAISRSNGPDILICFNRHDWVNACQLFRNSEFSGTCLGVEPDQTHA